MGRTAYQGAGKREETQRVAVGGQVAMKAHKRRRLDKAGARMAAERRNTPVRTKVEHPSLSVQRHFAYAKAR